MSRGALFLVGGVLVLFLAVGGFLVLRNQGGGGSPVVLDTTVSNAATMSPDPLVARQGDMVTIHIRSDRDGEVHLHGYDIHFETKAGEVASQTFRADKSGSFEIEWESTSTHLGNLVVNP
jgi:hypothetical protein